MVKKIVRTTATILMIFAIAFTGTENTCSDNNKQKGTAK